MALVLDASANPGVASWGAAQPILTATTSATGAISVTTSRSISVNTAGVEANTLAAPTFAGQIIEMFATSIAAGARTVTVSASINQAGNTTIAFDTINDSICLIAYASDSVGTLAWAVLYNNGCTLG
jgi:hypothetical protein